MGLDKFKMLINIINIKKKNMFVIPKSIASKRFCVLVELYINVVALDSLAVTKCSTLFNLMFSLIAFTADGDKSFAMISFIPGTSLAYRMLLNPVAESASSTRRPSF